MHILFISRLYFHIYFFVVTDVLLLWHSSDSIHCFALLGARSDTCLPQKAATLERQCCDVQQGMFVLSLPHVLKYAWHFVRQRFTLNVSRCHQQWCKKTHLGELDSAGQALEGHLSLVFEHLRSWFTNLAGCPTIPPTFAAFFHRAKPPTYFQHSYFYSSWRTQLELSWF